MGRLSGGEKDIYAPKPIADKVVPSNRTLNFNSNSVEVPFDEFIKLNNPAQNIFIIPPHATISANVKGKTLYLKWGDTLQENTTYSIYLNGAVEDISEGNDSIIQYVFSTGNQIDTLTYTTYITDAWTNKPIKDAVLALFDVESGEVINFAASDEEGKVQLNYIQPKTYKILAFVDENKNLVCDKYEAVGFREDSMITISYSVIDSLPIRLFYPRPKPQIRTLEYKAPGMLLVGTTHDIKNEIVLINGELVPKTSYHFIEKDSLQVFFNADSITKVELVLKTDDFTDTSNVRAAKSRSKVYNRISKQIKSGVYAPSDSVVFEVNDIIVAVDTSKIKVIYTVDSVETICPFTIGFELNKFTLTIDREEFPYVDLVFDKNAIACRLDSSLELKTNLIFKKDRNYGIINFDLTAFDSPLILQVLKRDKVVKEINVSMENKQARIEELPVGEYTFKIIYDENNNGKWDVGNFESRIQPEKVAIYTNTTKVRPNWEVDVVLIPAN